MRMSLDKNRPQGVFCEEFTEPTRKIGGIGSIRIRSFCAIRLRPNEFSSATREDTAELVERHSIASGGGLRPKLRWGGVLPAAAAVAAAASPAGGARAGTGAVSLGDHTHVKV